MAGCIRGRSLSEARPGEPFRRSELRDCAGFANRWSAARSRWPEPLPVMKSLVGSFSLLFVLLGCGRRGEFDQQLSGTWAANWNSPAGSTFASTTTISANGNYSAQTLVDGAPGERTVDEQGRVQVRDGVLIDTMTNYCKTNLASPITTRGHIVRFDAHELVVNWEPNDGISTNDVVFRRLEK